MRENLATPTRLCPFADFAALMAGPLAELVVADADLRAAAAIDGGFLDG